MKAGGVPVSFIDRLEVDPSDPSIWGSSHAWSDIGEAQSLEAGVANIVRGVTEAAAIRA